MSDKKELPPFVRFYERAVEDRSKLLATGAYGFRNIEIAEITRPGQRDTTERDPQEWLADLEKRVADGLAPSTWLKHFRDEYLAWKEGREVDLQGTPIRTWPVLDPATVEELLRYRVRTVEELAALDDTATQRIGLGTITFRQRARDWLEASKSTGKIVAQQEALRAENDGLKTRIETLEAQLAALAKTTVAA